jgi:PIN domain nuclease of toxin-antitoxin system
MMLLLDTQMVIWATGDSPRLPAAARRHIGTARAVYVSAVSLWEIGMKTSSGKLKLPMSELEARLAAAHALPLPVT